LALFSSHKDEINLPELLDELAFDDQKRKEVQATANLFLHAT
jgi:hypothetical protein